MYTKSVYNLSCVCVVSAYEAPYLYITYFNTLQVMEVLPGHADSP